MNGWTLTLRSLRHFWRTHLGVVLGVTCATAVLVGALSVGDSVRLSLREQALQRIGRIDAALVAGDRFVRAELGDRIAAELGGATCAPVMQLPGVASGGMSAGRSATRAGIVDVFGVDRRFFGMSVRGAERPEIAAGHALVNDRLARQLDVSAGDEIVVRVERPSLMPREATLATVDDLSFGLRVTIDGVLDDDEFGRFGLRASQVPPFDLFVSLAWLQQELELPGRANMLLVDAAPERADAALRASWNLADAELRLRTLDGGALCELTSRRVFIDAEVVDAVTRIEGGMVGVFTYFVNAMQVRDAVTPYSMVSGIGPLVPGATSPDALAALRELVRDQVGHDGIVLNDWAAEDLGATAGDTVQLDYFVLGPDLGLEQRSRTVQLRSIVPLAGAAADPSLMPAFPGLAEARSCADWEPGVPIELDRLDDADQAYWDDHRGTPKAFVPLAAAQAMWGNRFGDLTAIRAPAGLAERIERELPGLLDPAELGLFFGDLRGPALAAGDPATDFGGLFLGLSLFLIVASLLLTALLFVFGVEQRASEIGALLALGFRPSSLRWLFAREAVALATVGAVLGAVLGVAYTQAVLAGLATIWRDTIGQTRLSLHVVPASVAGGGIAAVATSLAAIAVTMRSALRRPAVELLRGVEAAATSGSRGRTDLVLAATTLILAVVLIASAGGNPAETAGAFFAAGALLLVGALAVCHRLLSSLAAGRETGLTTITSLGLRNTGRRPWRSLATIGLLASGTFLVVAVQAHHLEPPQDAAVRASGTGGFALFGRSTMPVLRDLGSEAARDAYGLDEGALTGVAIVPLRVRDGDDASCLNLSQPQRPRLAGVDPAALADRRAFRFAASEADGEESPWLLLDADLGDDVIPAIGDAASVKWALHKSVGDTLRYRDEAGRPFDLRIVGSLAGSILQGDLVVAERHLLQRFPSTSGHRMFLVDAPAERVDQVSAELTRAFEDIGLELTPTARRLAAFQAVQNTYLSIFLLLGGLGLLLGTMGLGTVVLRNALERRGELAVARAVGFSTAAVRRLLWIEHALLLALGVAAGSLAAFIAIQPTLGDSGPVAAAPMVALVVAVAASGALWVWLASVFVTRGRLRDALRGE